MEMILRAASHFAMEMILRVANHLPRGVIILSISVEIKEPPAAMQTS